MKNSSKILPRLMVSALTLAMILPLSACRKSGGDGVFAELADASNAKDATYKMGTQLSLDQMPGFITTNGTDILFTTVSYDYSYMEPEYMEEDIETGEEEDTEDTESGAGEDAEPVEGGDVLGDASLGDAPLDDTLIAPASTPAYIANFTFADTEGNLLGNATYTAEEGSGDIVSVLFGADRSISLIETRYPSEENEEYD